MTPKTTIIFSLILSFVIACSGSDNADPSPTPDLSSPAASPGPQISPTPTPLISPTPSFSPTPTLSPSPTPLMTRAEKQALLIGKIQATLDEEDCDISEIPCDTVEYIFDATEAPSHATPASANILILDSGIYPLALTGYRNRITNLYSVDEAMNVADYQPTLTMPNTLDQVFDHIASYDDFISVQNFAGFIDHPALPALYSTLGNSLNNSFGHGYFISAFMFEHNPHARFVLVEHNGNDANLVTPQGSCPDIISNEKTANDRAADLIRSQHDRYLQAIETLVSRYEIDYINASWGISGPILDAALNRRCGGSASAYLRERILEIDRDFMQGLSELSYIDSESGDEYQTILVQAGAVAANHNLVEDDPEFPADCDSTMQNRIRVNTIDNDGMTQVIPQFGSSDTQWIQPLSVQRYIACTDIFLPVGTYTDSGSTIPLPATREKSLNAILHGFTEYNTFPGLRSSSFAPPIIISALNHIQSQTPSRLSLEALMSQLTNGHIIIDPLLYDQFNVFELEYRDR